MRARKRQRSNSDGGKNKQLMELPVDTLVDILSRLPAKSVGCIKCVSKTLLNMVNNFSFSTLHTRSLIATKSAAAADEVPRLMCCSRSGFLVTLESLKYEDKSIKKGRYKGTIWASLPCFPRFVFYNLFCLGTMNGDCILVNGLGERGLLRLPEISFARRESGPNVDCDSNFGMGFDDKTNTFKIVCVTHEKYAGRQLKMTAHVLVLGTNSWRQISSLPPPELARWIDSKPVYANGAVHWWIRSRLYKDNDGRIVSFDLRREEFSWTPTPPTLQSSNSNMNMFTLRGCLAIVETKSSPSASGFMIKKLEIWVLKDFDEKQWVRYYYSHKLPKGYFPFDFCYGFPMEWEHGIFFTSYKFVKPCSLFFIDLRSDSINHVKCSFCGNFLLGMYSYSETLISLRDYGDLEEAYEVIA